MSEILYVDRFINSTTDLSNKSAGHFIANLNIKLQIINSGDFVAGTLRRSCSSDLH